MTAEGVATTRARRIAGGLPVVGHHATPSWASSVAAVSTPITMKRPDVPTAILTDGREAETD